MFLIITEIYLLLFRTHVIYKTKVLDISADGYKGLYHLMDSIAIKGRKLHYINPKRAEIFFNTIFVETK